MKFYQPLFFYGALCIYKLEHQVVEIRCYSRKASRRGRDKVTKGGGNALGFREWSTKESRCPVFNVGAPYGALTCACPFPMP